MKINKETLDILKNFSNINPNLVIKGGNVISTIAEAKNIMASATISEDFPKEFGIYDLNEFLSALSLIEDPQLEFGDDSVVIKSDTSSLNYRYADSSILTSPQKEVNMPPSDLTIELTHDVISQIRRAGTALGHPVVSIKSNGDGVIFAEIKDPNNSSAHTFSYIIKKDAEKVTCDFQLLISNLKLIAGNYDVSISSKLISHWKETNSNIQYWIALEKNSSFNS